MVICKKEKEMGKNKQEIGKRGVRLGKGCREVFENL
jgi:hypothetical protein